MAVPENLVQMNEEIRSKTIKWYIDNSNNPHILNQIYNYKYYNNKMDGLKEVIEAVKDKNFGIIISDFRDDDEKAEFSKNQWLCLYFSKIENKVFCVPIWEGNDFLELRTIHPANSEFHNIYWKLHKP